MGEFETKTHTNESNGARTRNVSVIALVMTALAFLAPVGSAGYGSFVSVSAILWSVSIDAWSGIRFAFLDPFTLMMLTPFLLFRIVSVYIVARYYQAKTTKGRGRLGAFLADAPILFIYLIYLFTVGFIGTIGLNLPLPIMTIFGLLMIWKFPVSEPTVPWEGPDDFRPWWEEKPKEEPEPAAEDQPW